MRELIVDLFAGGGGASLGIEQALGRSPDIAINHDAEAVALHAANHPNTRHFISDVWEVDPARVCAGRPVGLLWASPDCKHFSKAKGGQPVKKRIRALAWVVVKWAKAVRPRVIMLENVEEFATWGPLVQKVDAFGAKVYDLHGSPVMVPCKKRKGETFHRWRRNLERLGYRVEWRERRACNAGAGTIRKRLYLIARCDGRAIVWPEATHGDPRKGELAPGILPWVTAAESIDWSLPCPSIFDTAAEIKARHGIKAVRPLKPKTMARIAKGVFRYVINAAEPFIIPITHGGGFDRAYASAAPLNTLTGAKRGELAVVQPFVAGVGGRMGQTGPRATGAPMQTATAKPDAVLVTPFVTKFRNGATGQEVVEPLATITAHSSQVHPAGAAPLGVVAPILVRTAHGDVDAGGHRRGRGDLPVTEPAPTSLGSNDAAIVVPHLMTMRDADKPHQAPHAPAHTITAGGAHPALVAATLSRQFGASIGSMADEPVGTVTPGGAGKTAVVAAFLAQHNTDMVGHEAREPVSTIVQKGCTQAVVQAELQAAAGVINLKGTGADQLMPRPVGSPAPTLTAQGRHVAEVRAFLMKYHGQGGSHDPREPLRTIDCNDRVGILTVHGVEYQIVDIGMRMLTPRERYNAQGFPPDYKIEIMVEKTVHPRRRASGHRPPRGSGAENEPPRIVRKPLSAEAQGRMVGNSVCPPEARALAAANCIDLAVPSPRRATA